MYTRILEKTIKSSLFKGKVIILYGPRQVGKTTLVKKVLAESEHKTAYFQCDIVSQRKLFSEPEPYIIKNLLGDIKLVVLDEAQLIENIGTVLKVLVDTFPDIQIIATGSSSFDLANKIKEPLTGRAYEYMLYPLSFNEVYQNKGIVQLSAIHERAMRFGWFPAVYDSSETDAVNTLELLQQNTLYKDILTLENIKKPRVLEELVIYLAYNIGSVVTTNNISREIKTTIKTVERYLDILEKMFVIKRLYGYSNNIANETKKGFKAYFIDIGIRNSIIKNHNSITNRNDIGGLFENMFIMERIKQHANTQIFCNTYFWRTYKDIEVDYIEEKNGLLTAFECKYTNRPSKGLQILMDNYKNASGHMVDKVNYQTFLL
jgi:uncharacterized protein